MWVLVLKLCNVKMETTTEEIVNVGDFSTFLGIEPETPLKRWGEP